MRAGRDGVDSNAFRRNDILASEGSNARRAYQVVVGNLAWGVTSRMLFEAIEVRAHGNVGYPLAVVRSLKNSTGLYIGCE